MNNDDNGHLEPPITTNFSFQDKGPTKLKISTSEEFFEPVYLGTDGVCSLMSAEGHKRTWRLQFAMSALHSIADIHCGNRNAFPICRDERRFVFELYL